MEFRNRYKWDTPPMLPVTAPERGATMTVQSVVQQGERIYQVLYSWEYESLDSMRQDLLGRCLFNPNDQACFYVGENLVLILPPEFVYELAPEMKSPRQRAWEALSDEQRKIYCRGRALRLLVPEGSDKMLGYGAAP